jgi:hypothetical protein
MGMFDYVNCKYPLPFSGVEGKLFQTKDLGSILDTYEIREDGSLWGEVYDIVDRSEPSATGLARLSGALSRENIVPKQMTEFTGDVFFYTDYGKTDANGWGPGWVEFRASFEAGHVKSIVLVENRQPPRAVTI